MERSELKRKAKELVDKNLGIFIMIGLAEMIIAAFIGFNGNNYAINIIFNIILIAISALMTKATILASIDNKLKFEDLMDDITNVIGKYILAGVIIYCLILLGSIVVGFSVAFVVIFGQSLAPFLTAIIMILYVVFAINISLDYALVGFIACDKSSLGYWDTLKESKKLMKGNKADYIFLQLSFILWYLLVIFTFGIAGIYVSPYILQTTEKWYEQLEFRAG